MTPPTAEGGPLRVRTFVPRGDPTGLGGTVIRVDPVTGAAPPDNPQRDEQRSERPPDRRLRLPQSVPHRRPARHERGLGRRRGLGRLEEINRAHQPAIAGARLRLAVLRGRRAATAGTARPEHVQSLYAQGPGAARSRTSPMGTPRRSCRARPARPAGRRSSGLAFYPRAAPTACLRRRAVLRGLLAQLHLGHVAGAGGLPEPGPRSDVRRRQPGTDGPVVGPTATSTTWTWTAGRSGGSRLRIGNRRRCARHRDADARAPHRSPLLRLASSKDPEGDPLTYAWDLDGDGAFDDSSAVRPCGPTPRRGCECAPAKLLTRAAGEVLGDRHRRPRVPCWSCMIEFPAVGTMRRLGEIIVLLEDSGTDFLGCILSC